MLSQDIRNLARVFSGFGALESGTELEPVQARTYAWQLDVLADRAERLEDHTVPAQARCTAGDLPPNVTAMPRSKPWNGNPPGTGRGEPPEGGAA